jgi:hypothetical protein
LLLTAASKLFFQDFFAELWLKQLEPVYNYKIEPWLSNKTLLRLLVTDTRGSALREATRDGAMDPVLMTCPFMNPLCHGSFIRRCVALRSTTEAQGGNSSTSAA